MIVVRLCGGLGNQMFQYAAGRRLALANGTALKLDLDWFDSIPPGDTPREYELHVFNSVQDRGTPGEIRALRGIDIGGWPKFTKKLLAGTGLLARKSWFREKDSHFDSEVLRLRGDVYLDGFWQSARYFADAEETIKRDFTFRFPLDEQNAAFANVIQSTESVSMHVRRGDYVESPDSSGYHGVCSPEYYRGALAAIAARVKKPHIFVFSDDPAWVKGNLNFDVPMTIMEHNGPGKGYEDLRLMSLCRHHIIANSTFSWWGAWLCGNTEKAVIAPVRWFSRADIDTADLIPEGWLRL